MLSSERLINLVAKYAAAPGDARLEMRFKNISREMFTDVYSGLLSAKWPAEIVYSVVIISDDIFEQGADKCDDICYSRRLTFDGQAVSSDKHIHSLRLEKPVYIGGYIRCEAVVVRDLEKDSFRTNSNAQVNFNITTTFSPQDAPGWTVCMVCTKRGVMKDLGANLRAIRRELFVENLAPADFLEKGPLEAMNIYDIIMRTSNHQPDMTAAASVMQTIFSASNPVHAQDAVYQGEIYEIAKQLYTGELLARFKHPDFRLKKLSTAVIALSKNSYYTDVYPPVGYLIIDKADGQRAMISVNGNRCRYVKSDAIEEHLAGEHTAGPITVLDAELVNVEGTTLPFIFDVITISDQNVSQLGIEERIKHLEAAAEVLKKLGLDARAKRYVIVGDNVEAAVREVWGAKYPYDLDGLIMAKPGDSYSDTRHYKWKPYSHNTIDFLAAKCPSKMLGIKPYEKREGYDLYLLFVGISHRLREKIGLGLIPEYNALFDHRGQYYPVQFSPSMNPMAYIYYHPAGESLDRKIVELSRSEDGNEWVFHRVRSDRQMEKNYYGNDFKTAEQTYSNYVDVFALEDLWKAPTSYFLKTASTMYDAPNKYKRFVISAILRQNLAKSRWIIDEAAGRGADLHRYEVIGVQNTLFIDIDATAIAELIRRKLGATIAPGVVRGGSEVPHSRIIPYNKLIVKDVRGMTVHTLVQDLTAPAADLEAAVYQYGMIPGLVDGIVCNFALHYMCDTIEHMRNILTFNASMLKVGGLFMFTVMDGEKVFNLLKGYKTGQQWESREGSNLKYAIMKKYSADKLTPAGQTISVLLPFSDKMYDEPLCNVGVIVKEAKKLGLEVELNNPMDDMMKQFAASNGALQSALTEEDIAYIGLHKYVSLRKIK